MCTPTITMTQDLPPELWMEVASYLPDTTLRRLYGLNRLFFNLAMNKIYEQVTITADGPELVKMMDQLEHESLRLRVRKVHFDLSFLVAGASQPRTLEAQHRAAHRITRLLSSCHETTNFAFSLHDTELPPEFGDFLSCIWSSLGPNLQSLSLDLTWNTMSSTLLPLIQDKPFTDLKVLEIKLTHGNRPSGIGAPALVNDAFIPFLTSFTPTLQSLLINLRPLDLGSLWPSDVLYFPHLTSLSLEDGFSATLSSVRPFVEKHPSITHLAMNFKNYSRPAVPFILWMTNALPNKLPNLSSLTMNPNFPASLNSTANLSLKKFIPGLRSLRFIGKPPEFEDLLPLLYTLCSHSSTSTELTNETLQDLTTRIQTLTPSVIMFLASTFPKLRRLDLRFNYNAMSRSEAMADAPSWGIVEIRMVNIPYPCTREHSHQGTADLMLSLFPSIIKVDDKDCCSCSVW